MICRLYHTVLIIQSYLLQKSIGKVLYKTMTDKIKDTKLICGVPYAALPFATVNNF